MGIGAVDGLGVGVGTRVLVDDALFELGIELITVGVGAVTEI